MMSCSSPFSAPCRSLRHASSGAGVERVVVARDARPYQSVERRRVRGGSSLQRTWGTDEEILAAAGNYIASEEVAVRTGTGQFEDEDIFVNLVDEKPVWRDVAFAVVHPVADERMVVVLGRKLLAVGKLGDYGLKLLNRQMPSQHQLIVALERGRVADGILHFAKSSHILPRSVYVGLLGSRAMRSPSSRAATVSALGMCVPSMRKGMRFSRMTVLMYTVMTDEAESPTSSQKRVKRSFVALSREIVMLAMSDSPCLMWKTGELYAKVA